MQGQTVVGLLGADRSQMRDYYHFTIIIQLCELLLLRHIAAAFFNAQGVIS